LIETFPDAANASPLPAFWARQDQEVTSQGQNRGADRELVFPYRREIIPVLEDEIQREPGNGRAFLYLGHLLFHLGRHAEARQKWEKAAELGADPVVAYRALGMAAKSLDSDLKTAREWLGKANRQDPRDAIVARDLARVLFSLADSADSETAKRELVAEARDLLQTAFEAGKGRSDFVALLGRGWNRLGQYGETVRMLDQVRVTVWEGAREVHDLFQQAHLAIGDEHFAAGRAAEALAEFDRALEYPQNLATGRLENAREAHIQWGRGKALKALGRKQEAMAAWRLAAAEPESKDAAVEEGRRQATLALNEAERE
jgi:tetratricopeptide (TPR) repeat protein